MIARLRQAFWTLLPWWWPDFLPMPPTWREEIERRVYGSLTQHEWFTAQIDVIHAVERERSSEPLREKKMRHVDDFIDDPSTDRYAVSWFESFRRPALDKIRKPDTRKLFATYVGCRHLVTGCSRMGDVWLHSNLAYNGESYEKRVDVDTCSLWSEVP